MTDYQASPEDERGRLAALARYGVLDTRRETSFDDLASLAAQICDTPAGLITFVDEARQFFTARIGYEGSETAPLDSGFCPLVVRNAAPLVIPDTTADPAYQLYAAVIEGGVRFYAGVPLITADHHVLGAICVLDYAARPDGISDRQLRALEALAAQTVTQLELRRAEAEARRESERAIRHSRRLTLLARVSAQLLEVTEPAAMVRSLYALIAEVFQLDVCLHYQCQAGGLGLVAAMGLDAGQQDKASRLEFGETVCGMVAATRQAAHVTDIQASDDFQTMFLKSLGIDTYVSAPLMEGDALLGTLSFGRRRGAFSCGELEVLRTIAANFTIALCRLHTEERRLASELALRSGETTLREAQNLNTLILNSSRDCIVVLDLEGHTRFVSAGGIESMEISDVQAILGLSWLRVWQGADHQAARMALAEARAGRAGRFQGYCPTHKGTPKWWDVVISPLSGRDGTPEQLVSVGRDITDRVQARERLTLSEEALRLATEAAEIGTWDLNLKTDILTWSDRTKAMFGISPDQPCSMDDFYAGLHPEDREATSKAFAAAIDPMRRANYDAEYRCIGKEDGVTRWIAAKGQGIFDADGRCVRAIGTAIDITARKAADQRLLQSEAELRALNADLERQVIERSRERGLNWQVSPDLLGVVNHDGYFELSNPAWQQVLGWSEAEIAAMPFFEFVHPDDFASTQAAFKDLINSKPVLGFENRYRHKDGGYRWLSWVAAPEGQSIYATGRHITAEKQQAEALKQAEEQLRQSQKMEAVGQLTGGIAHDFNNLLTGITGSLELLQARIAQGRVKDLERYISAASGAASRAAALTHRLLAFSRRQTLDPKPTSVNRLAADMEELIQRTVGPAILVEMVLSGGLWPTLCDPNQLENALLNLAINARDAMPDGGRLTVETGNRWLDDRAARERDLPPGQYVSLCVSDNGTGMTAEVVARAFDPFFTTKPLGMGTGLGLSMIYGFARQSGGQVRIYSEIDQGTMVCIYLPRHRGILENQESRAELAEAPRAEQGETVLIVDDEPTVRMLVTEVLEDLGYTALEAADGASGLRVLQSKTRIDLLVTDVGLPGGMNGRQLADAARQARPDLRVLFITGYAENAVIGHGHLDPGMHVLTKPFAMETLASRIKDLISGS